MPHLGVSTSYEQALADISDRSQLMEPGNQFYAKAEGRITSPGDLIKLAEAVFDDLGDNTDLTREILGKMQGIQPMFSDDNGKKVFDANLANLERQNCTHPRRSAS